jgi:glycosyltransferase involved in cell wall biosynthesis
MDVDRTKPLATMNEPCISVLMPVYNAARHLDTAIASIFAQEFSDWEMVAVDDGSTDASPEILTRWAARDSRIRVLSNSSNKGQTACLNQGLSVCRGAWVARQDADDLSHPERFTNQMCYLESYSNTALLGTQGLLIDDRGARIGILDVPRDVASIAWCAPFLNPFLHTAVMFRRNVVVSTGGYDESFRIAQDYELWTRLAADHATANLSGHLVSYRHAETSLSKTGRELAFEESDRVSNREVARRFGRLWRTEEKELVAGFRRGVLDASEQKRFWKLIAALEVETGEPMPRRLRAAWHLRLAGSSGRVSAAEVFAAFQADTVFAARWLIRRFAGF